jgi:nitrilase
VGESLTVGLAQISPVWLDRDRTIAKVVEWVGRAAADGCRLVAFGEALVPGYPFWVELTDGARFESPVQKAIFAHYLSQGVQIESGHLDPVRRAAAAHRTAVYLGCVERPADRGGHTLYCSLVYIDPAGEVRSVHRKLMPTYEERLVWGTGDGHGLRCHPLGGFTVGGLNCWENWMPLPRAALSAMGEDLHVAVWPGSRRNTEDITRFVAREGRSYVLSVSGTMRAEEVPAGVPHRDLMVRAAAGPWADGGSCVAGPDGRWVVEPQSGGEALVVAELDAARVREERQNFDPSGHYSRPDVTRLLLDQRRQSVLTRGPAVADDTAAGTG